MRRSVPVRASLPGEDADARQRLAQLPKARVPGDLHVRLRSDGRVRLTRAHGTTGTWPSVTGRLTTDEAGGVVLVGTGRECRHRLLLVAVVLAGLVGSVATAAAPSADQVRLWSLAATVVFALLLAFFLRQRRHLRRDVDELTALLQHALT